MVSYARNWLNTTLDLCWVVPSKGLFTHIDCVLRSVIYVSPSGPWSRCNIGGLFHRPSFPTPADQEVDPYRKLVKSAKWPFPTTQPPISSRIVAQLHRHVPRVGPNPNNVPVIEPPLRELHQPLVAWVGYVALHRPRDPPCRLNSWAYGTGAPCR